MTLTQKIVAVHEALSRGGLPHAFGGALALAWCTGRARATIDIDINVFVNVDAVDEVMSALPTGIEHTDKDGAVARRKGQVRLWWEHTPVDLFLNTTEFHEAAADRVRWETFMERPIPFLSCLDIAVFKAFFNRTKDWADLEEMEAAGTLDVDRVTAMLIGFLGADDERIGHMAKLAMG
jgi:hypothetical protein